MKNNKGITIINAFQKFFDESNRKPNAIWEIKGSEFYNILMKSWSQNNAFNNAETACDKICE